MSSKLTSVLLVLLILGLAQTSAFARHEAKTVDGVVNLASNPSLLANWLEVPIGEGTHTITLVDSDYGTSPGTTSKMVFVYTDQLMEESHHLWFFSLNGQGDHQTIHFRAGGRAWFGFMGYGPSDHGGTTVRIDDGQNVYVSGQEHTAVDPDLLTTWVHVGSLSPASTIRLLSSDFGSSPGAVNAMVFVYNDQLDSSSYDHQFFTLNGIGDAETINYLPQGGNCWLGFVAWGSAGVHGGSIVELGPVAIQASLNTASVPGILSTWLPVSIGGGAHTITLVDSDYGTSPGATNRMVFVYTDQVMDESHHLWLFTLNGPGDSQTVHFLPGGRAWFGFVGYGPSDHGGTTVRIDNGQNLYVSGLDRTVVYPQLLQNWLHVQGLSPTSSFLLSASDYGTSPGACNEMAIVYNDQLDPSSYDHMIFTLNGVRDAETINYLPQGGNCWLGFIGDTVDDHGGSLVDFDPDAITGIAGQGRSQPAPGVIGYPVPNPVARTTRIDLAGLPYGGVDWKLVDVAGRLLDRGQLVLTGGRQTWTYRREVGGSRTPAGTYWVIFRVPAGETSRKLVLLP